MSFDALFDQVVNENKSSDFDKIYNEATNQEQPSRFRSLLSAPLKGAIRSVQTINPLMPRGPIQENLQEKLLSTFLPTQEKQPEKILERAGEIAPYVAVGPEGAVQKGLMAATGAVGGHFAEEAKMGPLGQALTEAAFMSFPGLFKSLGKAVSGFFKKPAQSLGEHAAKAARLTPDQINEGVREAAERLNVLEDLPLSAQTENAAVQSIETKLMQSQFGKPIQEKLERAGEKLTKHYEEAAQSISSRENLLPSVVSQEAVNALKNIEAEAEKTYNSLYRQSEKFLPELAMTETKTGNAINKIIDSTSKKLRSALGTPAKDALFNRLERLKSTWGKNLEIQKGNIPIRDLIELNKDLNQVIKYEAKGGVDKALVGLQNVIKNAIQEYGHKNNKEFLRRYNEAQKLFGENAKNFRKNPVFSNLVNGDNPQSIFNKMNTVKGINELEGVFQKSPQGKEAFDALKRYKLEDILNKRVLDKNGNISWGKAAGLFKEPKIRDLSIKLLGKEQYQKLRDLSKVANGIEQGFKKFLNTSKTAVTAMDMAILVGLPIKAAQQLFTGNVLGAFKTVSAILLPSQLSKLVANPEFVEAAIKASKAGIRNNKSAFMSAMEDVARITAAEMAKNKKELSADVGEQIEIQ